jgi:hypothetical protein
MSSKYNVEIEGFLKSRTCPVCGKTFYVHAMDTWTYKTYNKQKKGSADFCSWHCLRAFQKMGD